MSDKPKLIDIEANIPTDVEVHAKQLFENNSKAHGGFRYSWESLPEDARNRWRLRSFIEKASS